MLVCPDSLRVEWSDDWIPVETYFRTYLDRPRGPLSLLYNGYRVFPGSKVKGHDVDRPLPFSTEVEEKIELYRYPPSGPLWLVTRRNLHVP